MDITNMLYLPTVASSHGHKIDMVIYLVHILMIVLFVGWGIFFIISLARFNRWVNPKANYKGVQNHFSTVIEVGVIVFEALLLVGFSIPLWNKQVNAFPNRTDTVEVRINAEQFAWNVHYPGADGIFGNTDFKFFDKQSNPMGLDPDDPNGKDDFTTINQLHLPIGRPAIVHLTSRDVMHSFFLPIMRVKQDVIPGISIPTWFTPTKTGKSEIACAQLCGLGHYRMRGFLTVHSQDEYQKWFDEQSSSAGGGDEEYDDFWN
jgi:cytochrome c oxidase subunit 2